MKLVSGTVARAVGLVLTLSAGSAAIATTGSTSADAADQSVTMAVLPPVSQPGSTPAPLSEARTAVTVTVTPTAAGRVVRLERQSGRSWKAVAEAAVDARGLAEFRVATYASGSPVTYRATALADRGLSALTSATALSNRWGPPDFADEFAGTALGASWSHRGQDYNAAGLRRCSKGSAQAVQVSGGTVRLSVIRDPARPEPCTAYRANGDVIGDFSYRLNGHISTAGQHELTYGVVAARVRFQERPGQHGAFWLQPSVPVPGAGTAAEGGAEIDVVEWFGAGLPSGGLSSSVYYPTTSGQAKAGGWIANPGSYLGGKGDSWWSSYHVFSVEWSPSGYVFRVDGRETFRTGLGVSERPQYLILSLLSSDYELPGLGGEDRLPQHMDVDWVQFWRSAD
jgi:beta-glucanase (GH16 family)